jgi:hypothetical protein
MSLQPETEHGTSKLAQVAASFLIVDDHAVFRGDARELLEVAGYRVIGEASDGTQASTWRAGFSPTWCCSTSNYLTVTASPSPRTSRCSPARRASCSSQAARREPEAAPAEPAVPPGVRLVRRDVLAHDRSQTRREGIAHPAIRASGSCFSAVAWPGTIERWNHRTREPAYEADQYV